MLSKNRALLNYKKAQTHINKIIKMIEENRYCVDIMQQNLAVIGLLRSAHETLMESHLNSCFKEALKASDRQTEERMIEEILKVTRLFNR